MAITYTQADLDSVKEALLTGATRVRIGDREIEYRSQKDLKALMAEISSYINGQPTSTTSPNNIGATFTKGEL